MEYNALRNCGVYSDLIAVTDEAINSVNIRHFEDLLHKKLRELEDLRIIETYD